MRKGSLTVAAAVTGVLAAAGCGGRAPEPSVPEDGVRRAAAAYVEALQRRRWADACARMTPAAQQSVARDAGASCPEGLGRGAALPAEQLAVAHRQLAGARVRVKGGRATLGPVADLPEPLRFEKRDARWLVAP
jgi:hypothetical protein